MANCYEPRVPNKSEHEQPVGNMDVHNNVQQLGLQVPSCRLCFDLPASGVQGGQRFPVPDEGRAWFGVWSGRTQAESVPEIRVFVSDAGVVPYLGGAGRDRFAVRIRVGPEPRSSCFRCGSDHRGQHWLK